MRIGPPNPDSDFRTPCTSDQGHATSDLGERANLQRGVLGFAACRLDGDQNLVATVDMTDYYATIAESWFGVPAGEVLATNATPIPGIID
jgi:hypothetical protein